jgi:hypothetical protein
MALEIWGNGANLTVYKSKDGFSPAVIPPSGYHCHCPILTDYFGYCSDCYLDPVRTLTFSNLNWNLTCTKIGTRYVKVDSVTFPSVVDVVINKAVWEYGWSATSGTISWKTYSTSACTTPTNTYTDKSMRFYLYKTAMNDWQAQCVVLQPGYVAPYVFNPIATWSASGSYCNWQHPTSACTETANRDFCTSGATCTLS